MVWFCFLFDNPREYIIGRNSDKVIMYWRLEAMQTKRKEEKGCREKILELERREFEVTRGS